MVHHSIARVLYVTMIAVLITTGLVIFAYSQTIPAKADNSVEPFVPYAGTVISPDVPLIPNPGCPDYILMQNDNISPENPYPEFGLFVFPGAEADTYDYQTLDLPTTNHIGGYLPIPQLACGITETGTPVFPVFLDTELNGAYFMDGGSLGPDIPGTDN